VGIVKAKGLDDLMNLPLGSPVDEPIQPSEPTRSAAATLVDMAMEDYILGVADDGTPYGTYPDTPHVALPLRGGKLGLRASLARSYFRKHDTVPSSQALADACTVLEGEAAQKDPRELHLRVADKGGRVYLDMADKADRVIEFSDGTWRITDTAPVVFRRTELSAPIPEPIPGGDLDKLWGHVNIAHDDRPITLAVLVAALIQPNVPHVILSLQAEHGSAKTTTAKRLVSLIDPSPAPVSMPPRDIDAWVHTAYGSWVVAIDNVSTVQPWWSDALCRAATGDALAKRRLYTDADLAVLKFRRCVILTGIDLGGLAGDLSDRLAQAELRRIDKGRQDETALDAAWERDYPAILGALFDLAASVHAMMPNVTVDGGLPRMADFAKVLACVDKLHDTDGLKRYRDRATHLAADSLTSDSFIAELVAQSYSADDLTAREILQRLTPVDKAWRRPRDWPKNARTVTTQLTKHAPALRQNGWTVEHDNRNHDKVTRWTITSPDDSPDYDPQDPQDPQSQVNGHNPCGSTAGQLRVMRVSAGQTRVRLRVTRVRQKRLTRRKNYI
jgi:hypothetical protein